jgi:hypothetical protein
MRARQAPCCNTARAALRFAVLLTLPHLAVHRLDAAQSVFRPIVGDIGTARRPILLRCTHRHAAVDRHLGRR